MTKHLPTPELLRKLLRYEPGTGKLFWRERPVELFSDGKHAAEHSCRAWNARYSGNEALTSDDGKGYRQGKIFDRLHSAHRVIWAIETGAWPVDEIDHIDHDRSNNRFSNLREVTRQENMRNSSFSKRNTSGVTGVSWNKMAKKWHASITADGRQRHLGYFRCITAAIFVRKAADIEHGYSPNHGRKAKS